MLIQINNLHSFKSLHYIETGLSGPRLDLAGNITLVLYSFAAAGTVIIHVGVANYCSPFPFPLGPLQALPTKNQLLVLVFITAVQLMQYQLMQYNSCSTVTHAVSTHAVSTHAVQ